MKISLAFLSALISSSAAFSPAASGVRSAASSNSALGLLPKNFELAADCAMNVGQYSLEEMELLANDLERQHDSLSTINRDPVDSKETLKMIAILRAQHRLIISDPDFRQEYEAAHQAAAQNQILSFPTTESEPQYANDYHYSAPTRVGRPVSSAPTPVGRPVSSAPTQVGRSFSSMQTGLNDPTQKDFGVNVNYNFGPSLKELTRAK